MKANSPLAFFVLLLTCTQIGMAADFQISKITKNLMSTPEFNYGGGGQYRINQRDRWLEVEVEFVAAPDWTDELTLKYYILFNGSLLTGEVTHVNIPAGRENRSVMYISPLAPTRLGNNRPITTNSCQNIAVQIMQQGTVKDELNLVRAQPQWYANMSRVY